MNSESVKQEQPKYFVVGTAFFIVCLRPLAWVLAHYVSVPLAFGLSCLTISLLLYPLFYRGGYRPWSWQRSWSFWHFAVFDVAIAVGAFFLAHLFVNR
jgi:uncharacterized membrane protein (DUF4010 family)